jgi:hypothetical protein
MSERLTAAIDDDAIWALVSHLARPHSDGGHVIERAAILAAGSDAATIEAWILAHAARPEQTISPASTGPHAGRLKGPRGAGHTPRRFLLPPGALDDS